MWHLVFQQMVVADGHVGTLSSLSYGPPAIPTQHPIYK